MTKRFTGWHMTLIMIAFFGVVVSVNMVMAMFATGTFGGTVVDNSYVASQNFNRWLSEAREQERLRWRLRTSLGPDKHLLVRLAAEDGPLDRSDVAGVLSHPLGREPERHLTFSRYGDGTYRSRQSVPAGRWVAQLTVRRGDDEARFVADIGG